MTNNTTYFPPFIQLAAEMVGETPEHFLNDWPKTYTALIQIDNLIGNAGGEMKSRQIIAKIIWDVNERGYYS